MKDGWITRRIGDVAKTQYGLSGPMNQSGKGFKIFRMGEVQDGRLIDTGQMKYTDITPKEFHQYKLLNGDILFNRTNSFELVGKTGMFALDGDYCFASYLVRLNLDRRIVLPNFLNYLMNSDPFQQSVKKKASRSINQANINATILANEQISFPSLPEQQRIVRILDEAFDGLATAAANAEKNLRNARTVFESHLQSIFADAWDAYPIVALSDLATDITDGDHLPPPKSATGVPFITIGNIVKESRKIDFSNTFMVPRSYYELLKPNRKPKKGDVLYTVTGSFGIPVIVDTDFEFCFQRHIGLIRPKPDTSSAWLFYLLASPQLMKQANDSATGTAQRTVSLSLLRSFKVPRIPTDHQQSIVSKLDRLSAETQRLESIYQQKLAALGELKKSLLHQAFSGEL